MRETLLEHNHLMFEKLLEKANVTTSVDDCIKYLEEAIMLRPNDFETWFSLGQSYYTVKDNSRAVSCFNRAIKLNPKPLACYYKWTGLCYLNDQIYSLALNMFDEAIKGGLRDADTMIKRAHVLYSMNKLEESAKSYYIASLVDPSHPELFEAFKNWDLEIFLDEADKAFDMRDYELAASLYREACSALYWKEKSINKSQRQPKL